MGRINERYRYKTRPECNEAAVVKGDKYRFTVLTPALIRLEYSENGCFEDRATQLAVNRFFDVPDFHVIENDGCLRIRTDCMELVYHGGQFRNTHLPHGSAVKRGVTSMCGGTAPRAATWAARRALSTMLTVNASLRKG